jgi:hypothetical protein
MMTRRPSLAGALSGTSSAASVRHAAARLVTGAQIKGDAITSAKAKDRSLPARDFAPGPAGPAGPAGHDGAPGPRRAPQARPVRPAMTARSVRPAPPTSTTTTRPPAVGFWFLAP